MLCEQGYAGISNEQESRGIPPAPLSILRSPAHHNISVVKMSHLDGVSDHELKGTLEERLRIIMQGDPGLYDAQLHEKREAKVDADDSAHHRRNDPSN